MFQTSNALHDTQAADKTVCPSSHLGRTAEISFCGFHKAHSYYDSMNYAEYHREEKVILRLRQLQARIISKRKEAENAVNTMQYLNLGEGTSWTLRHI